MTIEPPDTAQAIPTPIPGRAIDPPPKEIAKTLAKLEEHGTAATGGFRGFLRFSNANSTLLAAGTAYYAFVALFAIIVAAFGLTALIGGQRLADAVVEALNKAFPGLIGDSGISPEGLQQVAQTTSLVGLGVLLVSGSGAMVALSRSLHLIYGAPKDPRNFVLSRLRLLGWLLLLVPLMALSFIPSTVVSNFADPVIRALGLEDHGFWAAALFVLTGLVSVFLNALVIWLMLSHLGGIRPGRGPLLTGTAIGALGIEILKYLLNAIIGWSVEKPQYGAFATPIAVMLVLYLEALVVYFAASVTAGLAEARGTQEPEPA